MKLLKYLVIGLKLWLLMMLVGLILIIPSLIYKGIADLNTYLAAGVGLVFLLSEFVVAGWALWKYRSWIFKKKFF